MTAFFIVDSKTEYNALLGRDWIHQTSCIPSSLYQPFEANMIQSRYYDDHVSYITLQGFNDEGRPTQISVQKAIELTSSLTLINQIRALTSSSSSSKEIMVMSYLLTKFKLPRPSSKTIGPKLRTPWKKLMLGRPMTHDLYLLVLYFPNL
ncbi:hypothetical protein ACFX2C_002714 [Malus domestica]